MQMTQRNINLSDNNPTVSICMSTYNGARFVASQIDSILKQDYENWILLIHDDGSTDDTVKIIKKYSKNDDRIYFVEEDSNSHLGVKKAFFSLSFLKSTDFYMFSDQDDIWKPNKVSITLKEILKQDQSYPVLVHTNYEFFYNSLDNAQKSGTKHYTDFKRLLLANNVTGCTCMFNKCLRDKLMASEIPYPNIIMHDWWLAIIASSMGKVVYINESTIYYRQHSDNVVGAPDHNFFKKLYSRIMGKSSFDIESIVNQARVMYEVWNPGMSYINKRDCKFIADLAIRWSPIYQLVAMFKYSLFMNSRLKNIQFALYIIFPRKLRKKLFGNY